MEGRDTFFIKFMCFLTFILQMGKTSKAMESMTDSILIIRLAGKVQTFIEVVPGLFEIP